MTARARISGTGLLGFAWGVMLGLMPLADFAFRPARGGLAEYSFEIVREPSPKTTAIVLALLALGAIPMLLAVRANGLDLRRIGLLHLVALANIFAVTASLTGRAGPTDLAYVVLVTFTFALGICLAGLRTGAEEMMAGVLRGFSGVLAVVFLIVLADGNFSYGRLMGRSGPNFWGMTSMAAFFASLAWRNLAARGVVMAIAAVMIVLVQSRGSLLATAVGASLVFALVLYHSPPRRRYLMVFLAGAGAIVAGFLLADVLLDKLLMVNDTGRGLHSGGTGRLGAWIEALNLFANSPLLGVGYRKHEALITAASSAHNAYLAVLADMGLVGIVSYLALMFGGAALALRRALREGGMVSFAIVGLMAGYLFLGLVERVALNTGNALSLLVIFSACYSFRSVARVRRPLLPVSSILQPEMR